MVRRGRVSALVIVSGTTFTVRDHGVHTAFREQVCALQRLGVETRINDLGGVADGAVALVHTPGPLGLAALRLAGERGVAIAHVTPQTLRGSLRLEPRWRSLAARYLRRFYGAAGHVIAVSHEVAAELREMGLCPAAVVRNGIDTGRIAAAGGARAVADVRARYGAGGLVLGVGQVQPRKGIAAFVSVARGIADATFAWVGGRPFGPLTAADAATQRAVRDAPGNVVFTGRVPQAALDAHYHAADVFLFPSRQENFGQVVVEAAAAGLPLVLSDLAVFRSQFAPEAALCAPHELPPELRRLLGDAAYRRAPSTAARRLAARHDSRGCAEELLATVRELSRERRVRWAMPTSGQG